MSLYRFRQAGMYGNYWIVAADNKEQAIDFLLEDFQREIDRTALYERDLNQQYYDVWALAKEDKLPKEYVIEVFARGHVIFGCNS